MAKTPPDVELRDPRDDVQSRMSFGEHLDELRKRIISAMMGSVAGVALCIVYYKTIIEIISRPYRLVAAAHNLPPIFHTLKPQEAFLTSVTLAFQAGLILTSPWIIYQIWKFVASGLFARERRIVYRYTVPSAVLFLLGVLFFYFIVLPMTLNFFMGFTAGTSGPPPTPNFIEKVLGIGEQPPGAVAQASQTQAASQPATQPTTFPVLMSQPAAPPEGTAFVYVDGRDGQIKIRTPDRNYTVMVAQQGALFATTWRYDDYLSFVMFTALVFGLAFELPMVIVILAQVGIVPVKTFRGIRKYAYFAIIAIAAIAAPSADLMTLAFLAVPLLLLYEIGIVVAATVVRRNAMAKKA